MTHVIKRGGKKQNFSPAKIKNAVKGAVKDAGFSGKKVEETVKTVGDSVINFYKKRKVVKTTAIRKSILGRLERISKAAAASWRRFEKNKKGQF